MQQQRVDQAGDVVLDGGNMGGAVRRGDRVIRPSGPWTPTIHALLEHLRAHGIAGVPEPFGVLPDGREELEFIAGVVPNYPMPEWLWQEELLDATSSLLRKMHDASLDFAVDNARWQLPAHSPHEVICHNDFAPYNLVFHDGNLVGVIDFDTASPGSRAWDLCYLAYRMVPLIDPANADGIEISLMEKTKRLARLVASYGNLQIAEVLDVLPTRLRELAEFSKARGLADHATLYLRDADWVLEFRDLLVQDQS